MHCKQTPGMVGEVEIIVTDKVSGEVIDHYGPSKNRITDEGVSGLWRRASTVDTGKAYQLKSIFLGMDFGDPATWSSFNPEPPTREFSAVTQDVVYQIPTEDVQFEFPNDQSLRVRAFIDGQTMMDDNFPDEVNLTFTSATIRFSNDTVLSYKRFPIRSISREVDVDIIWTITLRNGKDYCETQGGA